MTTIVWFTLDLRLNDNPALNAALTEGDCIPVFILDEEDPAKAAGASRWWLHHSLTTLAKSIRAHGGRLILRKGKTIDQLQSIIDDSKATGIVCSRAYEPWLSNLQTKVHQHFAGQNITCKRFGGRMLCEPEAILNKQQRPFQVFTPFYKTANATFGLHMPPTPPHKKYAFYTKRLACDNLKQWNLLPQKPNWAKGFKHWQPGEEGAHLALKGAIDNIISHYDKTRDIPGQLGTSKLSPHLHFGEVSPRTAWREIQRAFAEKTTKADPFVRQLFWREFSLYLLHHNPHTVQKPFQKKFNNFPWRNNKKYLNAWQKGLTGYPIVDAGMRELWHTGWMHNRVRMIVASFLTKHLNIHWKHGADWFWDTLLDADLANNTMGWQWVAGCGADAAPYFRIFNPILQSEKFDSKAHYLRQWLPELKNLDNKSIHAPWRAPEETLQQAGITLGVNYPKPIVDHTTARENALHAYKNLSAKV